ncbi:N-acyl amino acid synthase FeeM domain-containing protein [Capsulimonas corticalis]|nr:hypothetical protein [Capsulimonas corticalis]
MKRQSRTYAQTSVATLSAPQDVDEIVRLFERLAAEEGWEPGDNLRIDRHRSVYFAGRSDHELAGGLQMVLGDGSNALPSQRVWPEIDLSGRSDVAHVVILALRPEYRARHGLFWNICVEMWKYCVARGVSEIWIEATPKTLRLYRRIGWPLEIVGDLRMHWDEPCFLCRMGTDEVAAALTSKAERSAAYKAVVDQAGPILDEPLLTKAA